MSKFNDNEVKSLDEIIQENIKSARILMWNDIETALNNADGNLIELEYPSYLDGNASDDSCFQVYLDDDEILFDCENSTRSIDDLGYEQLHTVWEALRIEGCFNED